MLRLLSGICCAVAVCQMSSATAADPAPQEVRRAILRASEFYRKHAASHGGYVYYYAPDFSQRWGEGPATRDQLWVQPPGTPTVGLAFLRAWEATGEPYLLKIATEAGHALVHGQLSSGAWTNAIDFDPRGSKVAQYRNGRGRGRNFSTLDDGISQSAITFLVRLDKARDFEDPVIHEAAEVALKSLLAAQFRNGGFPQGWDGPITDRPVTRATYPEYDWRTEGRIKNYWDHYTLNDSVAGYVAETLITAHDVYDDQKYLTALRKLGDFLMLAQMPEPQPAWAQQYNEAMQPIWARKFEPPAISGWESQDVIETLMTIHEATGDRKYLEPIPAALAYLRKSLLPDGRLARYYELRTNRPLYMQRRGKVYTLTHDDSRLPGHYGWKMPARLRELEQRFEKFRRGRPAGDKSASVAEMAADARRILSSLDDQGRWVSTFDGERLPGDQNFRRGDRYIGSDVFSRNLTTLSDYLDATAQQ